MKIQIFKILATGWLTANPGDVAVSYADPTKAKKELGWEAEKDLDDMCRDA